jgi:hypothetical protein
VFEFVAISADSLRSFVDDLTELESARCHLRCHPARFAASPGNEKAPAAGAFRCGP